MPVLTYNIQITQDPGGKFNVRVDSTRGSSVSYSVSLERLPEVLNMCLTVELCDAGLVP